MTARAISDGAANSAWVLGAVCLAGLMMPLSFTGPAVALPAIGRDLGGSPLALAWVVNAFVLSFGSFVMAAGALSDQLGRKRMFRAGVAGFALLSLVIGFAPSVVMLDLLRGAQGVAAAIAMAGGAASLAQEFEGPARTRAFSLLGTSFGIGLAFGPILAGVLVETLGWRAIFLTGTVIGSAVLAFGVPRMRESRDPGATGVDWPGLLGFTAALVLLTFGIMQGPQSGWGSPVVLALLLGAAAMLALFVAVETRVRRPMLDLSLFRYPRFVGAQFLPIATAVCFVVPLVLLPVRFIGAEGMSEIEAGGLMIALSAPMAVVPFLAGLLARRFSAAALSGLGLVVAALGLAWLAAVPVGAGALALALPMLVVGVGTGLPWGLMDDLSVSVVPRERAGMATGIFSTMRVAGEAVAIAAAGAVVVALGQSGLHQAAGGEAARVAEAVNAMAGGDLGRAEALLPGLGRAALAQAYGGAFQAMLAVLVAATLVAAAVAYGLLRRRERVTLETTEACEV
ncbi:MFS family permease [Inquilinus ginsengisoli]|uniref:MFS family permease n=1 Tax=Inquilinus ginsengisoli TaxID=363840 RepID=A0ABU1K0R3_9PROT|nr:MFS transporter [Inquilinus ginsengisoli]MDR6293415.1 MFS family permease [Inquilinus ginsengisoli]